MLIRQACADMSTSVTTATHLNTLRNRAKLSVRALATQAGYKTGSGVQKFLDDQAYEILQPKIAAKFAHALLGLGEPPITIGDLAPLLGLKLDGVSVTEKMVADLLCLPHHGGLSYVSQVQETAAGRMPIVGSAHASFWMPSAPSIDEPVDWLTVPYTTYEPVSGQYVLKIVGPSVDKVAPEGTFAICQRFGEGLHSLPDGKFVHAERERQGEIEWTIKQVKWEGSRMILCPHSNHKDHQSPLHMGGKDAKVRILGVVLFWHRPA